MLDAGRRGEVRSTAAFVAAPAGLGTGHLEKQLVFKHQQTVRAEASFALATRQPHRGFCSL